MYIYELHIYIYYIYDMHNNLIHNVYLFILAQVEKITNKKTKIIPVVLQCCFAMLKTWLMSKTLKHELAWD